MKITTLFVCLTIMSTAMALPVRTGAKFKLRLDNQYIIKANGQKINHKILRKISKDLVLIEAKDEKSLTYPKIYPNYQYFGDYKEVVISKPNDTFLQKQFHHKQIKTFEAWTMSQGDEEVVVAITDNEFQVDHLDLFDSWWRNPNEIPDNGIDDDNNGYIDDVIGWDFIQKDNNVDTDNQPTHGTHLAGIVAAKANNRFGGTGIAPKVKVMPLRWYGEEGEWTTAIIAETYNYAIDNGAKIISTSYNIDHLVDDELYRDTLDLAEKKGVLVFNSAGNGNKKNPKRQKIENVILVCSVTSSSSSQDVKSRFSNYGSGIDICAPGDPIFSTVQIKYGTEDRSANLSGTSMATPVAAAVAALIWSSHPNFSAEEVKARLYSSADDIDDGNFLYKKLLGHGRVDAYRAVK